MPRTLTAAVNSGWAVIGAAAEAGAVPLGSFTVDRPTVLVMGE
jgi:tRNA G18 (ribose-2'-O)-methylase SpoU